MKSLKNILVVLLVAAVAFTFVSCSDASAAKVGEYYTYKMSGTASGQAISYEFNTSGQLTKVTYNGQSYTSATYLSSYSSMANYVYSFKLGTGKKLESFKMGDESLMISGTNYTWVEKDSKLTFKAGSEQLLQMDVDGDGYKWTTTSAGTSLTYYFKKK